MSCKNNCHKNTSNFNFMNKEEMKDAIAKNMFNRPENHFVDMPDRFVLEDDITHQEDINDQINLLIENLLESPVIVDVDEICNTLQGIASVHELRTKKLWQHFKMIFELDEYNPDNILGKDF